ncbi:helix-turn-helix transcriptional regulator [uncultured Clostridium sp.]|uniref:helix-turn-helix transcriptional regulator n=1 Tax=uncultured Clostridium sp. TaxID=59620 RepID=UPI002630E2BD|nr:helix-turn-helix transcriptional regulator [uncultured Clostridium sp.]
MALGNRLKEIRMREYMMNQKDFADMLGISRSTYNNLETGRVDGRIETALIISEALNIPVHEIWHLK